ncbi:MAG: restriction endonuclease subunit S [Methylovulum sp.]|nr:restriction endonuclease subunit S [Methylovulum sp.]
MLNAKLVKIIGFAPKENTLDLFHKKYADGYPIEIDFEKKQINYGDLIKSDSKTTQNLSQAENWVVLECVNRLLEKGYQPQNIILEKTWGTGHGTSGRLDILVTHDDGTAYLMIECKTYGVEFDKEFNKLKKDGGQLFTYFQQDKNAGILMLYASDIKADQIIYRNEIIKIEDSYRQTGNVKDCYLLWNKLPKNNGVFDAWVNPYDFQSQALTPKSLKDIKQEDSSFIFNQFLEILRHNVVSDKPNAFNKIFTLFLCKICDEKATKGDEVLSFQWLEGEDTHISFQKRLADLYKKGMKEFLEKDVTDLSDTDFENKYGRLDDDIKSQLLEELTNIRLKKNNEFAIKEVFDDTSFEENAKVVKEVVELLQGYKIRYTRKHSYLSDFFELLLTTGLKQESGQFFTPVPIAQFIIKSLPVDRLVHEKLAKGEANNLLPTIIDYAAGSGHFITESMHEMQRLIDHINPDEFIEATAKKLKTWKVDHFDWAYTYVYGIEKDYRLVKVGKVGCYLHGDGLAKIIHSDGLGSFTHTPEYNGLLTKTDKTFPQDNKQFDIVVSNPPYSVSAFKNNARKYYTEADFDSYDKLTDQSSEIECLFIERTKQLLKDGGMAGIILPSSILSNTGIYTKAREIILQYFDIVAIAELGNNTFMATGTNTVTLFLRRRSNYDSSNIRKSLEAAVADVKDVTLNGIEKPLSKYVAHVWVGVSFDDYASLLKKQPNTAIRQHELYQSYDKKFGAAALDKIIAIETEKLFYFILAYQQQIVLVKSGEKQLEKQFLGYEFSNRRGSEGIHPIQRGKAIDECTQLFDADVFDNPEKASTYIYHAFKGEFETPINEKLAQHVFRVDLVDLFTFDRVEFEKAIALSIKKVDCESRWELVRLGDVVTTQYGFTEKATDKGEIRYLRITDIEDNGEIKNSDKKFINPSDEVRKQYLLVENDIVIARSGSIGKAAIYKTNEEMIFASYLIRLKADISKILPEYLFVFTKTQVYWNQVEIGGVAVAQPNLNAEKIKDFKIPLPPLAIQEKIVAEIEILEAKEAETEAGIAQARMLIEKTINNVSAPLKKLSEITSKIGSGATPRGGQSSYKETGLYLIRSQNIHDEGFREKGLVFIDEKQAKLLENVIVETNDVLINITGASVARCCIVDANYLPARVNQHVAILRPTDAVHPQYLHHILVSPAIKKDLLDIAKGSSTREAITKAQLEEFKIPLPPIEGQQKIIAQILQIETRIAALEHGLSTLPQQKEAILKKYL